MFVVLYIYIYIHIHTHMCTHTYIIISDHHQHHGRLEEQHLLAADKWDQHYAQSSYSTNIIPTKIA